MKDLDVARVGRMAAEYKVAERRPAERFGDQPEVHEIQPHATEFLRLARRPQPHLLDHLALLFDRRQQGSEILGKEGGLHRHEFGGNEFVDQAKGGLHLFGELEIHSAS